MPITVLSHVTALLSHPDGSSYWAENHYVAWDKDRIVYVGQAPPSQLLLQHDDVSLIDASGLMLSPGLMDIHINGAFGCDLAHATPSQIQQCLKHLAQAGITSIVATVITNRHESMMASIQTLEEVIRQPQQGHCRILGIHLEGPLLNPSYCGIHNPQWMPPAQTSWSPTDFQQLASICSPSVLMMTLAPECVPMESVLPFLTDRRIALLAGHTGASSAQIHNAMDLGLIGITHLFNAMKPLHHRSPGPVAMALTQPQLCATLIADGAHVYPEALRLAIQSLGAQRGILVSDAIHLAGTPEGTQTDFAGQTITHRTINGLPQAINAEGTLAGSASLLGDGVRNVVRWQLADSATALAMATHSPSRFIQQHDRVGYLTEGQLADMVLWQPNFTPAATWINGALAYQHDSAKALFQPGIEPTAAAI